MKLREQIVLEKNKAHDIDALVDEIFVSEFKETKQKENARERLSEALERAITEADGLIRIEYPGGIDAIPGITLENGVLAESIGMDVTTDDSESFKEGAGSGIASSDKTISEEKTGNDSRNDSKSVAGPIVSGKPRSDKKSKKNAPAKVTTASRENNPNETLMSVKFMCPYDGFSYPEIEPRLFSFNSPYGACPACNGLGTDGFFMNIPCKVCKGERLRPEAMKVLIDGKNIVEITQMSIEKAVIYFNIIKLTEAEREIAKVVLKEIQARLSFMVNVGIEYLTLDRRAHTLSGGEAQRIRLASQLGSGLVGALYVLDEPTI